MTAIDSTATTDTANGVSSASRKGFFWLLLIEAVTFFVFVRVVGFSYVHWDDDAFVLQNAVLNQPFLEAFKIAFSKFFLGDYTPITILSFWVERWLSGALSAEISHGVNLALHIMNVGLVWFLVQSWTVRRASSFQFNQRRVGFPYLAILASAVFALHPLQVESVAWVSERKGLLSCFFALLALLFYERSRDRSPERGSASRKSQALYLMFFCLALLTKMTNVFLPIFLIAFESIRDKRGWRNSLFGQIPVLLAAFALGLIRIMAYRNAFEGEGQGGVVNLLYSPVLVLSSLGFYIEKALWPNSLSIIYPQFAWSFQSAVSVTIAICLVGSFLFSRQWREAAFVWLLLGLLLLLPVMNVVPRINFVSDRYMYEPLIGFALILASVTDSLWIKLRVAIVLSLIASLAVLSSHQLGFWRDDFALWSRTVALRPESGLAHLNLGHAMELRGDLNQAIDQYNEAIQTKDPGSMADALNNLAILHTDPKRPDLFDLQRAAELMSQAAVSSLNVFDRLTIEYNLATLYLQTGQPARALAILNDLLTRAATNGDSRLLFLKDRAIQLRASIANP